VFEAMRNVVEMVGFLKNPGKYEVLGGKILHLGVSNLVYGGLYGFSQYMTRTLNEPSQPHSNVLFEP
jgi:hypothetical protein